MQAETSESLFAEITSGKRVFQVISAESCAMLGIDGAEPINEAEASNRKAALDRLAGAGRIKLFKSGGGFYTVL